MAEVPFRPARQFSEYKGKGASASREDFWWLICIMLYLNTKRNPWANRFKCPAGPRVQPLFCRKYGIRIVNNGVTPLKSPRLNTRAKNIRKVI